MINEAFFPCEFERVATVACMYLNGAIFGNPFEYGEQAPPFMNNAFLKHYGHRECDLRCEA